MTLDGSGSSDPNGHPLTYQWTQTGGPAVTLSGATAVKPTFTAPGTRGHPDVPAGGQQRDDQQQPVHVTRHGDQRRRPTWRCRRRRPRRRRPPPGQTAAKAIDGVVDGYPGDYTKEWATSRRQGRELAEADLVQPADLRHDRAV